MCGIAGVVALSNTPSRLSTPLERLVDSMAGALLHRGPDASGRWVSPSGQVALAHRRLAIIDLSDAAHQPMNYVNRFWVTFNGEIYNFKAIRGELRALGHTFRSESDTEVLLAAVAQWGIDTALAKFVGMFAFAVWDERDRILHLARDRMGEKPLYIGTFGGYLYFASELRAFRVIPDFHPTLSNAGIQAYLADGCVPGRLSLFDRVYKLSPAHVLTVRAGRNESLTCDPVRAKPYGERGMVIAPKPYWDAHVIAEQGRAHMMFDNDVAIEHGEALLRDAVKLQSHADVPTGAFLSGGIDSSLVTALMQSQSNQPIRTFTVAFDDSRFDESAHARAVAAHFGTRHEEFFLTERDIVDQIPSMLTRMDEPTANGSFFPVFLISQLARKQVTVVLSGDGGDELFGGYNRYTLAPKVWRSIRWIPWSIRNRLTTLIRDQSFSSNMPSFIQRLAHLGSQVGSTDIRRKIVRVLAAHDFREAYEQLTSWWIDPNLLCRSFERPSRDWPSEFANELSSMLLVDQLNYLPNDNLAKVDRASMAASLETRLPLLDHRLVEFSWRLPDHMKIRRGTTKWLLRAILDRYLPRQLYQRPKMGFSVPVDRWLRGPLRQWAGDMLDTIASHRILPFEPSVIRDAWSRYLKGSGPSANELWAVIILAAWTNTLDSTAVVSGRVRS